MGLLNSLSGMVTAELVSADLTGVMTALNDRGIPIFSASQRDDVTLRLGVRRKDWPVVLNLCEKRGEAIRILHRRGLYWTASRSLHRPVLTVGLAVLLGLILYLPSRVLFVQVEGNASVPTNRILEAAENCGIRFGAFRRQVRSERVKNALLEALPQLQWAGVNTKGCVAVISVRERADSQEPEARGFVSGIVAAREGIVTSCTATRGNMLCAPGQAVQAGQLLISGYTDCGLSIRATGAEGEIYAQVRADTQVLTPATYRVRGAVTESHRNYSLLIGKKRINLWKDSGIWDATCGRIYEEYYITLPGGFTLPIGIAVEEITLAPLTPGELPSGAADTLLKEFAPRNLLASMVAGKILSREETVSRDGDVYALAGEYVCTEMIGRVQREQIGE